MDLLYFPTQGAGVLPASATQDPSQQTPNDAEEQVPNSGRDMANTRPRRPAAMGTSQQTSQLEVPRLRSLYILDGLPGRRLRPNYPADYANTTHPPTDPRTMSTKFSRTGMLQEKPPVCKKSPKVTSPEAPAWPSGQSQLSFQIDIIAGSHLMLAAGRGYLDEIISPTELRTTISTGRFAVRLTVTRSPATMTETVKVELLDYGAPWYTKTLADYTPRATSNYDSGLLLMGPTDHPAAVKIRLRQ